MAYGQNQDSRASSDTPGQRTESPLATELKRAGTTGELDRIIREGAKHSDDPVAAFDGRGGKRATGPDGTALDARMGGFVKQETPQVPAGNARPSSVKI